MLPSMPFQAKPDDIGGNTSVESIISDEQTLQRDLQTAIEEQNYAEAAKIRDDLRVLHVDTANGISGYDFVMESWEIVWMNLEFPVEIELKNVRIHVKGDSGYVTCMEFVKTTKGNN
ncbi:Nuclear transport factor 2 (NTF2) family protein isoform 3 [Hibiscus syriacus]|uniref:Nuclear transport factor 2 (NTF2) family protein isoform 3 n=1 Tax=Hibiscus syriacus TaxID=106335 RepID=A0A6A3A3M4_HIBSY|nr:Nuclear transport factor 2 (NTF2) family protein isoform 3 [Hibiscus syriacus]